MKSILASFLFLLSSIGLAQGTSLLDSTAEVSGFGKIRYRGPVNTRSNNLERPLVLFHGIYGGASHRTWRKLVPLLDAAGKEVYLMDLPGVGESDKPKRAYSIEDFDLFVERFLEEVVGERANVVTESILSNGALKVSSTRPDLIRRLVTINPSGVYSLNEAPSPREQALYDRLYNDDQAAIGFYRNLLNPNSLRFFLAFGFYDDTNIDEDLLADFSVLRDNVDQRFLSLSFVGGQLYRTFEESSENVFIPVLGLFGAEYENFQDNRIARAEDFKAIRPFFEYQEIPKSGSSVQREKPQETAKAILDFFIKD
jgi:pimeloyl-ACP methyl ester carboxylesterase